MVFALAFAGAVAVVGVSPSPSPTPKTIARVVTSDRAPESIRSAARTTYVVTHDAIERNGYRTVAQALQNVPGVEIVPLGPLGSNVDYGIRGSGSTEVLVLVDGLPAPGTAAGSVELGEMPTSGVDRIEVVEGGGSTLYGSGSIGGIINIITSAAQRPTALLRAGSFGEREVQIGDGPFVFSRTLASNAYPLADGTSRQNADDESTALHAGVDKRLGTLGFSLRAGVQSDHVGAPGPYPYSSTTSREDDLNEDLSLALRHDGTHAHATLQLGGDAERVAFSCDAATDTSCYQLDRSINSETGLDFDLRNRVEGARESLNYGLDLWRGVARADTGGSPASGGFAAVPPAVVWNALSRAALYAQQTDDVGAGRLFYGVRGERDGGFGGAISPSLGFIAPLGTDLVLRGNAATAFRAPTATELYFPNYGIPTLHPERARVADLTIADERILGGLEFGWFGNHTSDLIRYDFNASTLDQIAQAGIAGFTFTARTQPLHGVSASFGATDLYRAQNLSTDARLSNDPIMQFDIGLRYDATSPGALDEIGVRMHSLGANGTVDPTKPLFDQPAAYTTVDAYVRLRAGEHARLTLRGTNLGDARYAAFSGYPMPGRGYAIELETK